jgi:hypothetical protein
LRSVALKICWIFSHERVVTKGMEQQEKIENREKKILVGNNKHLQHEQEKRTLSSFHPQQSPSLFSPDHFPMSSLCPPPELVVLSAACLSPSVSCAPTEENITESDLSSC